MFIHTEKRKSKRKANCRSLNQSINQIKIFWVQSEKFIEMHIALYNKNIWKSSQRVELGTLDLAL